MSLQVHFFVSCVNQGKKEVGVKSIFPLPIKKSRQRALEPRCGWLR